MTRHISIKSHQTHQLVRLENRLNDFAQQVNQVKNRAIGYPVNQDLGLRDFYCWYHQSGLTEISLNNAGNPRQFSYTPLNSHEFENEVIDFLAPFYGFEPETHWGLLTLSGTQGNNLGIYFGARLLCQQTGLRPVLYVSAEAHYSIKQLADLQQLDIRIIKTCANGQMDIGDLESQLNPKRPALMLSLIHI